MQLNIVLFIIITKYYKTEIIGQLSDWITFVRVAFNVALKIIYFTFLKNK